MSIQVAINKHLAIDEGGCQDCRATYHRRPWGGKAQKVIEHIWILRVFQINSKGDERGLATFRFCEPCMMDFRKELIDGPGGFASLIDRAEIAGRLTEGESDEA